MKNLLNNTIAGTNNKGENTMNTSIRESKFGAISEKVLNTRTTTGVYKMFKGYKENVSLAIPEKVCISQIDDMVKFLSNNYAIADATGTITEGVNRVLNATSIKEAAKSIRDCGKIGTNSKTGQRYKGYGTLNRSTKVAPKLGGGSMTIYTCSKYEVAQYFQRLNNLDLNACNNEDLALIKADMQIIGRVLQEIAIDMAKDKSLDAGVDLKKVFTYLPVASRLVSTDETSIVSNSKEIMTMVEDAIGKNPVENTGQIIDSIPNYALSIKDFSDVKHIDDWAFDVIKRATKSAENFFNDQVMNTVKKAGATKEDQEIYQLKVNYGHVIDEMIHIIELCDKYINSVTGKASNHSDNDMSIRVATAKSCADKEVKAAFRDTLYAIGRGHGLEDSLTRKLVYAATMKNGIHKANISKAMRVLGEEDMLLMWSNEEGINIEAVEVELDEAFVDLFDDGTITEMKVTFKDDIATNESGEEVAYGLGMTALNGEGTIKVDEEDENSFVFIPNRKTDVAPIGTKRVALINKTYDDNGVFVPFFSKGKEVVPAQTSEDRADEIVEAKAAYFVPKTTNNQALNMSNIITNVGIVVDKIDPSTGKPEKDINGNVKKVNKLVGTTIKVGQAYINDMFINYKEIAGEKVLANNKKHIVEQAINIKDGILLVLSC